MKKFLVSGTAKEYYQEIEITAKNANYAQDMYAQMLDDGMIIGTNYEYDEPKVREIK